MKPTKFTDSLSTLQEMLKKVLQSKIILQNNNNNITNRNLYLQK